MKVEKRSFMSIKESLIEKLKAGKNVSDRALKRTLSNKDYQDYQSELLSYKNKSRPRELAD